jgi:hypothetical protein
MLITARIIARTDILRGKTPNTYTIIFGNRIAAAASIPKIEPEAPIKGAASSQPIWARMG